MANKPVPVRDIGNEIRSAKIKQCGKALKYSGQENEVCFLHQKTGQASGETFKLSTVNETNYNASTPAKGIKFVPFNLTMDKISPIPKTVAKSKDGYVTISPASISTALQKLGKPLLSSTKLHESQNQDRLKTVINLYKQKKGLYLDSYEEDVISSQLFHLNADIDSDNSE